VSSCRTSRPRDAPRDSRTASSLRRSIARASNRLATLAQATSKTIAVMAISIANTACASWSGLARIPPRSKRVTAAPVNPERDEAGTRSVRATWLAAAVAWPTVAAGPSRPTTCNHVSFFVRRSRSAGHATAIIARGTHISTSPPDSMPSNPRGAIPTTVNG